MVRLCNSSMQDACVCVSSSVGVGGWLGRHKLVWSGIMPVCLPAVMVPN